MKSEERWAISIIIPVFNEEYFLQNTLEQFKNDSQIEIIIVDGGSQDRTREIATQLSLENNRIKLVTEKNLGRANQMNCGAALAKGDILLFLHADTFLPDNYQQSIQNSLKQKNAIVGAFQLSIDSQAKSLRLVEMAVNLRSLLFLLPYGDQGFFLTKDNFFRLGGFSDLPIMEDFNFIQKAKHQGKIVIARATVVTSARRWQKLGVIKTTIINQLIIIGYYLKISPHKLKEFYRSSKS